MIEFRLNTLNLLLGDQSKLTLSFSGTGTAKEAENTVAITLKIK